MSVVHPDAGGHGGGRAASRSRPGGSAPTCYLDAEVFAQLSSLDADALDARAPRACSSDALRAFRRAGVDRDDDDPERLRELNRRESELSQAFSRGIRDGRRTTPVPGRGARRACPRTTSPTTRPTTTARSRSARSTPTRCPFLTHARDPECAARGRAQPSSTSAGRTTTRVLAELLEVREEKATPAGLRRLAELRRRGQDDRRGAARSRSSSTRSPPPPRRPAARDRGAARARPRARARTSSTSPTGATTPRRSSASGSASTPRRCAATSTPPRCARACSTSPAGSSACDYEPVDAPTWHPEVTSYDVRLAENRPAARPDPPRPAPARAQVQPRRAVHPRARRPRPAAARGRAGLQLLARADGPRPRRHAVPRVRPPDAPRARRPARVGALLRRRHRVGLRRGAVADARGVGLGRRRAAQLRHRRRRAHRSPRTWSSGCAPPTSSARAS